MEENSYSLAKNWTMKRRTDQKPLIAVKKMKVNACFDKVVKVDEIS